MSDQVIHLTQDNFDAEVLTSSAPVLVDFWAAWCGPCRLITPIVDNLAAEFADRAKVAKVNIDEQPELADQYGIHAIPSLLFFHHGEVVDQVVGMATNKVLADKLQALLTNPTSQVA